MNNTTGNNNTADGSDALFTQHHRQSINIAFGFQCRR